LLASWSLVSMLRPPPSSTLFPYTTLFRSHNHPLDLRLVAVTAANILAVAYAFMINDIEDAPDDALDPARAAKNPITSGRLGIRVDRKSTRLNSSHVKISYAVFCLKKKTTH